MNQTANLEDVIGPPVGSMVATGEKDPVTQGWVKKFKGLADHYQPGPADNGYRLGVIVRPQGPNGPAFEKVRVNDPVTGLPIFAWKHIQGVPAPRGAGAPA
jgi:hypothetical protein